MNLLTNTTFVYDAGEFPGWILTPAGATVTNYDGAGAVYTTQAGAYDDGTPDASLAGPAEGVEVAAGDVLTGTATGRWVEGLYGGTAEAWLRILAGPDFTAPVLAEVALGKTPIQHTITATIPEDYDGGRVWFAAVAHNVELTAGVEMSAPSFELAPAPDPDPDPDPDDPDPFEAYEALARRLAPRVSAFLGRGDDAVTVGTAEAQLPVVIEYVRGYTRGRGFNGEMPSGALRSVIVSATARLAGNPEQVGYYSAGDYSERPAVLAGWTLAELAVLRRYRRTAA